MRAGMVRKYPCTQRLAGRASRGFLTDHAPGPASLKEIGGRGRDRTGDPLLAKHQARVHRLFLSLQLLTIPINRGLCFRSKANPNELKTFNSCTVRVQWPTTPEAGQTSQYKRVSRYYSGGRTDNFRLARHPDREQKRPVDGAPVRAIRNRVGDSHRATRCQGRAP